jgi:hypothetical protein
MSQTCFECEAKRNDGYYPTAFEEAGYNHHDLLDVALSGVRGETRTDSLLVCDECLDEIQIMELENKKTRERYAQNRS